LRSPAAAGQAQLQRVGTAPVAVSMLLVSQGLVAFVWVEEATAAVELRRCLQFGTSIACGACTI